MGFLNRLLALALAVQAPSNDVAVLLEDNYIAIAAYNMIQKAEERDLRAEITILHRKIDPSRSNIRLSG